MVRLETPALDHDEVYEVVHRTTDLGELALRHDGFPPLYRWLVSGLIEATGNDLMVRWFSVLAGAATIPIVGLLGRRLAGPTAGLASAGLLAISANHVLLSQQGRGYALMVFFCALMLLTGWCLRQSDRWSDWLAFLASSWLAIATHYFAGLLLLIVGPALLFEKRDAERRRAVLAAVGLAAAGLPLVVCLWADMKDSGEFFHKVAFDKEAYAFSYLWLVTGNTLGPSVTELRELVAAGQTTSALSAMAPWALAVAVSAGVLAVTGWRRLAQRDRVWFALLLAAPPLMAVLAAPFAPTGYNYRYIVWMIVPLCVLLGTGIASEQAGLRSRAASVMLIVLGLLATVNRHADPRYVENDFHAVAALIAEGDTGPPPPAVIAAPLYYGEGVLYSLPDDWTKGLATAHPWDDQDWDDSLPRFAERIGSRSEAWLVTQWYPEGHAQRDVCERLVERLGAELVERVSSTVMVYRLPTDRLR